MGATKAEPAAEPAAVKQEPAAPAVAVAVPEPVAVPELDALAQTLLEDLTTPPSTRDPVYKIDAGAKRGRVDAQSFVAVGVHIKRGTPSLVYVNRGTETGIPLGVIGAALLHEVIADKIIDNIRAQRASL